MNLVHLSKIINPHLTACHGIDVSDLRMCENDITRGIPKRSEEYLS